MHKAESTLVRFRTSAQVTQSASVPLRWTYRE